MRGPAALFGRLAGRRRWLALGLGVKRWLLLLAVGAAVAGMGVFYLLFVLRNADWLPANLYRLLMLQFLPLWLRVAGPLLLGGVLMTLAVVRLSRTLVAPFRRPGEGLADSLYEYAQRGRGANVVGIGGGTGMPGLLRGLKEHTSNLTAIVTVADDGGSSGRLRQELGVIPPGDFRNNIAALARDEALMTHLLQYRFGGLAPANGESALRGHAFGNLLLAALAGVTGSFDEALLAAERVLAMRGRVLPATLDPVTLVADVAGGGATRRVSGESAIPQAGGRIERVALEPAAPRAYPQAMQAILKADLVLIGPGSLYTSILPNLLVPGLAEALRHSRALKVYVCNIATQPGETDDYSAADHVAVVMEYLQPGSLDLALANDNLSVPTDRGGGATVYVLPATPRDVPLVTADLVDEQQPWRHDSGKLAAVALGLLGNLPARRE